MLRLDLCCLLLSLSYTTHVNKSVVILCLMRDLATTDCPVGARLTGRLTLPGLQVPRSRIVGRPPEMTWEGVGDYFFPLGSQPHVLSEVVDSVNPLPLEHIL